MKTLHDLAITFLLVVALTSCSSASRPTEPASSIQTIQPTGVVIPSELAFSTPLIEALSQSGLTILSVQSSTYTAMFSSTDKAVWIKTNQGIVEAIFFADPSEVEQIHITEQPDTTPGRHLYTIQAPPPTLLQEQTIDAAYPLYFTVNNNMLIITASEQLDKVLKLNFSAH